MKAYSGRGKPLFLNFATRYKRVVPLRPDVAPMKINPGAHCIGGWLEHRAGFGEGKNLLPLPGVESRVVQLLA
jgi:hypothetical protein